MPKSRAIKGIDEDLRLNKALWHMAEVLRNSPGDSKPKPGHCWIGGGDLARRFSRVASRRIPWEKHLEMNTASEIVTIPLNKLVASRLNVRKIGGRSIEDLAASIKAHGLIHNLVVTKATKGDKHEVVAGARRLVALNKLAKDKDHPENVRRALPRHRRGSQHRREQLGRKHYSPSDASH